MRFCTIVFLTLALLWPLKVFAADAGTKTYNKDYADSPLTKIEPSIVDCSRSGSIALGTAVAYLVYIEQQKRKMVNNDFESWAVEHGGADSIRFVKDDLHLLYDGKFRSPALFGAHIFSKCMDAEKANIQWVNKKAVPMCFLNLEIANSIANAKHLNMKKEEVVPDLRLTGYTNFIDNGIGLSKVIEFIDKTYMAKNISEEIDFQEAMMHRCLMESIQTRK